MNTRNLKLSFNIWAILSFIFIALVLIPNANIFINLFNPINENWTHIKEYLLKDYIINSLILVSFTGIFTVLIGTSLSWIMSIYDFPMRKFFDVMNIEGAIFIFTLFLFPYVYIITKSFLVKQSSSLIENARVLGRKPLDIFFSIVLPISRGAIIGGVSLVILEVLNDYGVVKYYGVPAFSYAFIIFSLHDCITEHEIWS